MNTTLPGLEGRICVVTGGAGILGRAICRGLAEAGTQVAILDLNLEAALKVAEEIETFTGTRCIGVKADVLDRPSLEEARQTISRQLGPADFLINGAGGNSPKATTATETWMPAGTLPTGQANGFFDLDQDGFRFVFNLNFLGTLLPSQVFGKAMAERGRGVILNISSMNSFRPLTRIPAYSAAKASVNNFTQWLAVHLAPAGVRVNAIAPGFFLTEQNRFLLINPETGEATPRGRKIIGSTPMGRYGDPGELQGLALFLLSDLSSFITGTVIPADGGYSAYGGV